MTKDSIPITFDCECGSNLLSGQIIADNLDTTTLGVLTLLVDNINIQCPVCDELVDECEDDFSRTVGSLAV